MTNKFANRTGRALRKKYSELNKIKNIKHISIPIPTRFSSRKPIPLHIKNLNGTNNNCNNKWKIIKSELMNIDNENNDIEIIEIGNNNINVMDIEEINNNK